MSKLSVIVLTFNEENNIKDCLESVKWADEIILIDSNSSDKTIEIAGKYTDKVYFEDNAIPFGVRRNTGIDKSNGDWIFWIDADERVTPELQKEIEDVINSNSEEVYSVNRKSFFINKFIKHCGWYPDYKLRLFRKSTGLRFNELRVHEGIDYNKNTGKLQTPLLHYTDRTFEHYIHKMNYVTTGSALDLYDKGKTASVLDIIFRPAFTFFRMYFLKLGILDGFTGFILCTLSGFHVLMKYTKLYYLKHK